MFEPAREICVAVERLARLSDMMHAHCRPGRIIGGADTALDGYPPGCYADPHNTREGTPR